MLNVEGSRVTTDEFNTDAKLEFEKEFRRAESYITAARYGPTPWDAL
jgi:hypothetical protein